jgi:hypothetical protein
MDKTGSFQDAGAKPIYPWKYTKLDPETTAHRTYVQYKKGHCMYGVFTSVTTQLADKYGEPYRSFPVNMMIYGAGGVGGWGSLCGAANGSAALFGLFVEEEDDIKELVSELFLWYQQTELPQYVPEEPDLDIEIPRTVSNSVLCHTSCTRWCKVSGYKAYTKEQKERCKRLAADTARKTVEILNAHFASSFAAVTKHDNNSSSCMSCHTKGSELQNTRGKMDCNSCHTCLPDTHV